MPQFDVYELRADRQLVVDVQSDLLADALASRAVIPLFKPDFAPWTSARLAPTLRFEGQELVLGTPLMTGLGKAEMNGPIGSLARESYTILNAIDFLITGI